MDSPLNHMIDRSSNRKAASSMKAKAKRTKALNDQVLSLVHEANATALPERHVTPRAALIVMARAMKELSSLPEESRNHGVLREVSKFISLNQKTLLASASIKHVDLLPKGHPLSPLNASLTEDDLRKKYAEWIAADPAIADEARPLVAMAHSLPPESIEREHAFLRLRTLQASAVPAYFKIDDVTAITAAFSSGNSSAARRARVALQWRDRFGRWIEMGRGVNFRFRMPDGSIATGKGNYVGAGSNPRVERTSSGTSLISDSGLIEVSGVPGLAPGLYAIDSKNAAAYQARIPGFEAPQAPSFDDQFDADIPSIEDLKAARRDLPIGWKKQGPYFVSDDNYAVIPGPNGQPQAVTRLNADGRPAGTVGNARNWSEVNDLIEKDQPSFDKEIARIEAEGEEGKLPLARIPGATEEDVVSFDDIANMQKQRAEENKRFDESRPAAKPLGDKDLNGNVVPKDWTRDPNDDTSYTRQMPLRDGGSYPLVARVTEDGKYIAGHASGWIPAPGTDGRGPSRKFESWREIESSIPEFVDYLNEGFTKDNPIVADRYPVDRLEDRNAEMYYVDEDGNRRKLIGEDSVRLAEESKEAGRTLRKAVDDAISRKKATEDLRKNMEKNLPPREFPQEPRDDRYDARIFTEDLVEIDKSTLDALNKRMREDSTGEYNMEGVTFAPDNNGNIVMYPDAWEPGDKIIGRIEDDGIIDWESDAQYDKYADAVREALRGMGGSSNGGNGSGFDLGDYENSPEFIKQANEITKDWPTMDYATYINDKDPAFVEHKYMPLPEGSKLIATGLNGEDGNQLLVKLPDGNYILANDVLDNEDYPAFEQIYPASVGGPGDLYGDDNLSWEDATLDRLTNYDPYSGFVPLNRYGYFERFGIPKHDDRDDGKFTPPSGDGEGTPAEGTDNLKQVDEALAFLDKHMDDKGLSQAEARGIFTVQDDIKKAKKFLEEGNIKEAISYFRAAYDVIVGNDEAGDGYFPRGTNANKAENILDELLTSLEAEGPGSGEGGGRGGDGGDGTGESGARFAEGNSGDVIITNSIKKDPNGAFSEVFMGDYMEPFNTDDPWLDEVVKAANRLGIYVEFAPSQSGVYLSDEGIFRFTLSGPKLTPEQAKEFMGDGPDDAGVFGGAFDSLEGEPGFEDTSWQNLYNALTGGPGEPPSGGPDSTSGPYGSDFTEMVVDGAGSKYFMDRELEEMLDDNATDVGTNFADLMWDASDDRFDLQDQFDTNRPVDLNKKDFIEAAVQAFNKDIDANLESAIEERLGSDIDYDKNSFDAKSFKAAAERRYRELLEGLFEEDGDEGPDEPPSPGGGTPPKVPSPSTPGSPALIKDFDAPAGAYQLRTTEYEPEGRVDETSTDFTDDPRRLATKFTLDELVTALTQALIGRPSDDAMQDILDANVGDDDDLPDLDDLGDVANSPAPRAGEVTGTGAGALEFNAGEEYVLAEALYNAVYEAGGDPNRVIANAYDAVNGNRNNARKLLEAQGGVPSQEESQLIEDMTDEIRQIKDATPEDDEISASQKRDKPEKTFKGELIENVPVDFNNPDYYDMDTDAYIPSVPEIDENGYTDNPEILALDYFEADLIEQMIEGITDGSGVALLDFGGEDGVHEVPVEALRDALQLKAYNTNKILFDLRDESNDMSEPKATPLAPTPAQAPVSQVEFAPFSDALANLDEEDPSISPETVLMLDDAANALVDMFGNGIPADARLVAYNSANGMLVIHTPGTDLQEEAVISIHPNGGAVRLQSNIDWFLDAGGIYGWKPMPDEVDQAIRQENAKRFPQEAAPSSETTPASEAPASPFVYPGPREAGYSVNNTTLASDGSIVGAGSIVIANRDGKRGIVVSIQNDPEYVRIKFDDGKVAVRSANQIKAVSNPDGTLATAPEGALAPSAPSPATDVTERLDAPLRDAPNIARSGSVWGINDASSVPTRIAPFTQKDVPQSKFKAWRSRDAEIAKAANTRASFDSLFKAAQAALIAKEERSLDYPALMEEFEALLKDAYGARDGLTFGADEYRVAARDTLLTYASGDIKDGNVTYTMQIRFEVLGKNGNVIGEGSRYIKSVVTKNSDGSLSHDSYVKNEILKIYDRNNQKTGFATAYNRHMENWYIANGVEKVKVLAYGGGREWKGGFVWALNGFNWESPSSALSVARAIERAARTPQEKELATRLRERVSMANGDISQIPLPIEMALIGWYNGADNWLGKEVMTDVSWDGVKHLDPGAKEQLYSANYDQIKSAERRVRAGQNKANVSSMGLVQIVDNQFQDGNPDLMPYMEQIRDALRNNRPLGFLSPAAKAALNSYVSNQLLDKDSKMPMDDLFRLRNALDAEYRADYGFADPFAGVGDSLVNFSLDDFFDNSDALKAAGFASFPLGQYESGQNTTFRVIHKESGQVFFVKEESLSQEYNGERGVVNEIEANVILNALGIHGLPSVRASRENQDVFIMSQAGAILPLVDAPINADKMHYTGIVDANGQTSDYLRGTYLDVMANPEDILSMAIIDMLGDSEDRHDGNWMVAFDSTSGKMRIFPIDHGLNRIDTEDSSVRSFLLSNWPSAGEVYQRVMPRLIDKAGEARTKEMFLNQVEKLIKNLDNPLYEPKGEELAALISKWGSYEAFKDAMKERLTPILTPGTRENDGINKATKKTYWR